MKLEDTGWACEEVGGSRMVIVLAIVVSRVSH